MAAPRVSLREQQKLFTRQRLIDGALEVFRERGYSAATIDEIAEAAGASRATFYLHFASKLALAQAVSDELRPEVAAHYAALDEVLAAPTRAAVGAWLEETMAWYRDHQVFAAVLAEVRVVERDEDLGELLAVGYAPDLLPRYLAAVPKRQRERVRLRVALLVEQLAAASAFQLSGQFDVGRAAVVDELTHTWCAALDIR
jgi:AcrR family transcriptional regulator